MAGLLPPPHDERAFSHAISISISSIHRRLDSTILTDYTEAKSERSILFVIRHLTCRISVGGSSETMQQRERDSTRERGDTPSAMFRKHCTKVILLLITA